MVYNLLGMLYKRSYLLHCFWTFFSPQVWPDLPNVVINSSLDWDSQVEVKGPLWILGEVRVARKVLIRLFFFRNDSDMAGINLYSNLLSPCLPTMFSNLPELELSVFGERFSTGSMFLPLFSHKKALLACLSLPASQWSGSLPSHVSVSWILYTDLLFFTLCSFFLSFTFYLDIRVPTCLLSIVYKSWKFPRPSLSVASPTLTTSIIELPLPLLLALFNS